MYLTISVEIDLGTKIENAFKEAINLSIKLYCKVSFNYAGVICIVDPSSNYETGVINYNIIKEKITREKLGWGIYTAKCF